MADDRWIIVGLGNPGPEYAGTRHNVGQMVLSLLAERMGARFKANRTRNDIAEGRLAGQPATLARPHSYMNLSGGPVAALLGFYKLSPERTVVLHDELDVPFGGVRLKLGGGDNGHNGLRSISASLGTRDYYRVRFGIGRPPGRMDAANFVLRDFSATERKELPFALDRCADAVETLITKGLTEAQNLYHTDPPALSWADPSGEHLTNPDDHALAADLAERAGRLLLDLRAKGGDPDVLKDAGDRASHEFLMAELAKARPADAVLSEEGIDDKARLTADRVWIVDPLDGTREFGEAGRTDWAVHVALWERNDDAGPAGELTAGAVALPAQGTTLSTLNAAKRPDPSGSGAERPLRMVVSRTRASQLVKDVAALLNADLVPCGSAGAKAATVITGENDVYLHSGGFYEWDTAAPVAVARAAGRHVSRIDGSDVAYNQDNPYLPDILVCRPAIAGLLLNAIREATHAI